MTFDGKFRGLPAHGTTGPVALATLDPISADAFPTPIERLLLTRLPAWESLLVSADNAVKAGASSGVAEWSQTDNLRSIRGIRRGDEHDLWIIDGGLALYRHPGFLDRLFGWVFSFVASMFAPFFRLSSRIDAYLVALAGRLGAAFVLLSIPLAFMGFLSDAFRFAAAFLRALPALALSPVQLLREVIALPFRLAIALVSRFVRTLLLAWFGRRLKDLPSIEAILRRYPWLRGLVLGFLRSDRPDYPVLIPAVAITQVLRCTRRGLTGARHYLVVVEGKPIVGGFTNWFWLKVKQVVLPFYWERTVHVLCLRRENKDELEAVVVAATGKPAESWS